MIKQMWNRLQLLVSAGTVLLNSGTKAQVKVLDEELLTNIKLVTPYGFAHKATKGSQAYMVFPAGDRSFGIALIVADNRYQIDMHDGEVALHDNQGNHIYLKTDGTIDIKASTKVIADSPDFEITGNTQLGSNAVINGNLTVNGNISATGTITGH